MIQSLSDFLQYFLYKILNYKKYNLKLIFSFYNNLLLSNGTSIILLFCVFNSSGTIYSI